MAQGILDRFSPVDREVPVRCHVKGRFPGEIAAVLGISEGTATVRHFRALESIRKLLEDETAGDAR